jgi:hypothetical protein
MMGVLVLPGGITAAVWTVVILDLVARRQDHGKH